RQHFARAARGNRGRKGEAAEEIEREAQGADTRAAQAVDPDHECVHRRDDSIPGAEVREAKHSGRAAEIARILRASADVVAGGAAWRIGQAAGDLRGAAADGGAGAPSCVAACVGVSAYSALVPATGDVVVSCDCGDVQLLGVLE